MAKDFTLKVNRGNIRSILKGGGVSGQLLDIAERSASSSNSRLKQDRLSNPGFIAGVSYTDVSAIGRVFTANPHAARAQAKYHILESSI